MHYSSAHALLGSLIDYAGTFPPASLPLANAMEEACRFRRQADHPWLLSKVVLKMDDLKRLSPKAWYDAGSDGTPVPMAALGSPVTTAEEFLRCFVFEMKECKRFNERFVDSSLRQRVFAYETKLPLEAETGATLRSALRAAGNTLPSDVFFEISLEENWQGRLAGASSALADWCDENPDSPGKAGLKIRTGGEFVPTASQLCQVLLACAQNRLKLKATQGLHHAVTRPGDYGFVNLFGALAFASALGLDAFSEDEVIRCLNEQDPKAFRFTENVFHWSGHSLETEKIEAVRRIHGATFGSCSLAEPDVFLRQELGV
jgi:hypothetical protein